MIDGFSPGDVMVGEALCCNYFLITRLMAKGVDVRFEQDGSRITDFGRGRRLGARDHVVQWSEPAVPLAWMTLEQYAQAPKSIELHEVRTARQVLVTTLRNQRQFGDDDLSQLYVRRQGVALDPLKLRSTVAIDVLSCQRSQKNEKQFWLHLLADDIVRLRMAEAASLHKLDPPALGFEHSVPLC